MLNKAWAFIALIAFLSAVRCDISIFTKDRQQLDLQFKDAQSLFGEDIPFDGIKVFIYTGRIHKRYLILKFVF